MNAAGRERLRKVLVEIERKSRRKSSGRRFSTSPIVFGAGLGLADYLLIDFVPKAWSTLLPGGLDQAATLQGNASSVWSLSVMAHQCQTFIPAAIVVVSVALMIIGTTSRPARILSWLSAFGVILFNVWIVASVVQSSWAVTAEATGIG